MTTSKTPLTEDELALRIGRLTFVWNDVHFFVYTIFVRLMDGDYSKADAIFFGFKNDSVQRQMTETLSKLILG